MTLAEVIERLDEFHDELTIYAETEWTPESRADVAREPSSGLVYFLEVELAKEVLSVWSAWRGGAVPSADEQFAALKHYALHDAYLDIANPS